MLRPDQLEDLGWHIANPRGLMRHEPGVGKTPIACVLAAYHWTERAKKTLWVQPKSLLKKNRQEMFKFTDFLEEDVVILEEATQALTPSWTGPTIERTKTTRSPVVRIIETGDLLAAKHFPSDALVVEWVEKFADFRKLGSTKDLTRTWSGPTQPPEGAILVERVLAFKDKRAKIATPVYDITETVEICADLIAAAADAKVVLCGFKFLTLHRERLLEVFPDFDLCLVDEAHMAYGSSTSQNTVALYETMRHITCFAPMTATLIDGRLDTAFPIIHLIEPAYYGSYEGFIGQHAGWQDRYGRVTQWVNHDKITQILKRHSTFRSFKETYGPEAVLILPPEEVEMSLKVRAKYDEFHALAMLELENNQILDGSLPGLSTIRARQIMAHPETLGLGDGELTGKDELLSIYAVAAGPMVVFAVLVPEQERILLLLRSLGRKAELINGNVSPKRRGEIDEDFREGRIDTIVASPPTAGVGFNWTLAELIVFVSINYKDVDFFQSYRRGLRGKRETPLLVRTLLYVDSVDQRILDILIAKSELAHLADPDRTALKFS